MAATWALALVAGDALTMVEILVGNDDQHGDEKETWYLDVSVDWHPHLVLCNVCEQESLFDVSVDSDPRQAYFCCVVEGRNPSAVNEKRIYHDAVMG